MLLQRSLTRGDPLSSATRSAAPAARCCSTAAVPCIKVFTIYTQSFFSLAFGTQGDTFLQILTKWSTGRTGCKHEALDFMHAAIPLCPVFQTKWWIVSEKKYEVLRVATILHTKKPLFSSPFMNLNTRCIFLSDRTMESRRCLESFILPKLITSSI